MRKRIIPYQKTAGTGLDEAWLHLEDLAEVEITSEDADHPIENALVPGKPGGWKAGEPGGQIVRLVFAAPRSIRRIWLHFEERLVERTHEFVLRWSPDNGESFKEIVRQQWNFSPQGIQEETENIFLDLSGVTVLELHITPDISGGDALATLSQLHVG